MKQIRASRKLANTDFAECSPSLTRVHDVLYVNDDDADVSEVELELHDLLQIFFIKKDDWCSFQAVKKS